MNVPIVVDAVSIRSELSSLPAIQKTSKKSIVTKILGSKDEILYEDQNMRPVEVLIFIQDNECSVLLNTSGQALHKR
jgi:23S rRNA G2445 N2-methylase RlmL